MQLHDLHSLSRVALAAGRDAWPANIELGQGFLDALFGTGFKLGRTDWLASTMRVPFASASA